MGSKRPLIATPLPSSVQTMKAKAGFTIRGRQHKSGCRCRACRVVRMRGREKLVMRSWFGSE